MNHYYLEEDRQVTFNEFYGDHGAFRIQNKYGDKVAGKYLFIVKGLCQFVGELKYMHGSTFIYLNSEIIYYPHSESANSEYSEFPIGENPEK
jgi:hypothetical protein